MASRQDTTLPATRRPRKSTGNSPVRKRMDKENITVDVASSLAGNAGRKKSRSKSMGPGGLDVLKSGSGNRRTSLAAPPRPPPKSILKPTIPLAEIPPHKSKIPARSGRQSLAVQGAENLHNPFQTDEFRSSGTKIALRTEEEQQAAAREREEAERKKLEKEIKDRREARRKSLANRRVSFAAEATLHTFHEVEYMQDNTNSTDAARRASSSANHQPGMPPGEADAPGSPSSPEADASSIHYGDSHDETLASSVYSSDSEPADGVEDSPEDMGSSDSGSDSSEDADGVSVDLDVDEMTGTSVASGMTARSGFTMSDANGSTLDDALRLAADRAVTQSLDDEEEIIPSFGWVKKAPPKEASPAQQQPEPAANAPQYMDENNEDNENDTGMDMDMDMDMEMTQPVGGIIRRESQGREIAQEEDMSMDVTRALGGIYQQNKWQDPDSSPMRNLDAPDPAPGSAPGSEGDLMDFEDNEDMSMEFTAVMGGVLGGNKSAAAQRRQSTRRRTINNEEDAGMDETMDMTVGMGRIMPANNDDDDDDENEVDATMGMDMTMTQAIGGIIQSQSPEKERSQAKHMMEEEVDRADSGYPSLGTPSRELPAQDSPAINEAESASPGLSAFRGEGLRRSMAHKPSPETENLISPVRDATPSNASSPLKPGTPVQVASSSPLKTPPSRNRRKSSSPRRSSPRRSSPKRADPPQTVSTPKSASRIFHQHPETGVATPQIVLTPQGRRTSGVVADWSGLGSPQVADILDRRESIGDTANQFISGQPKEAGRNVAFADPKVMAQEIEQEEFEDYENDGEHKDDETATLRDMISNMSPKKNPLKGRKSLHVGSAAGILGKRPYELDDEDDEAEEENDGVKRLKGHQGSPVKNVHLQAPPTAEETTGGRLRSSRLLFEPENANSASPSRPSPQKKAIATGLSSPLARTNFGESRFGAPTETFTLNDGQLTTQWEQEEGDEDRIHLRDFLNLTNIRFTELDTTKRRHTIAPSALTDGLSGKEDLSLERRVVTGASTVHLLDLYQHSCRELKKYISEGRKIVRKIERDTFAENPGIFKEYISAPPEYKASMDRQFRNVKTHARLLSKASWYEWRMKLQDGLKDGLIKNGEDMERDARRLEKAQKLLDSVLPELIKRAENLKMEQENLQAAAEEMADCDPEDLQAARSELAKVDADVQEKMRKIEELKQDLQMSESGISEVSQKKQACMADIAGAEKIREECRGWTSTEISSLKAKVERIEKQHGWAITGISGSTLSMTYLKEIELVFDMESVQGGDAKKPSSPGLIELWYIAADRSKKPQPSTLEKEFFVKCIRDHVRGSLPWSTSPSPNRVRALLDAVSGAWRKANHVSASLRMLNSTFPTTVSNTTDTVVTLSTTVLLRPIETKVEVVLALHSASDSSSLAFSIVPQVKVVYGESFKTDKMAEFLATRIGSEVIADGESEKSGGGEDTVPWVAAVVELYERLLARGRKV